jgi:hypothetical protein
MKKFVMIALIAIGFIVIATPDAKAGVSIGIGFGFPIGYCGYPGYYPYGYYPYRYYPYSYYPYAYGAPYYGSVAYYSSGYRPYYWWHGRKIYYRHRHFR